MLEGRAGPTGTAVFDRDSALAERERERERENELEREVS
jgi:hypothetical protein